MPLREFFYFVLAVALFACLVALQRSGWLTNIL